MKFPSHIEFGYQIEAKGDSQPIIRQVHGNDLVPVEKAEDLEDMKATPPEADGVFTLLPTVELSVFTADCLPILFYSSDAKGPIAAVHCGWRGARAGIASKTVAQLDTDPKKLHAVLGPCLGKCCFEVREDLINNFLQRDKTIYQYLTEKDGQIYFSMVDFVIEQELNMLAKTNIHQEAVECTYCAVPSLPSYRRNKETNPRIRSWIRKKKPKT